jgi:hypothetical protein
MAKRPSEAERIARGTAAWKRLKQRDTWEDWAEVCDELALLRTRAMKLAATNRPQGKQYAMHMTALLKEHELDIPDTTRAAAIKCGAHLKLIEKQLDLLKTGDFATWLRMNQPQAVWAMIRPFTLTAEEKAEADQKKADRDAEKKRKAIESFDLRGADDGELCDLLLEYNPEIALPVARRLVKTAAANAVILTGGEGAKELTAILTDEFKLDSRAAYSLIDALRAHFVRPEESNALTVVTNDTDDC